VTIPIGTLLNTYEIVGHLGSGGMGEVYEALDTRLGRQVALKMLPRGFADDHAAAQRLAREARVLASLNHPNIATVHGFEESEGTQFIVMELVEGDTLADEISRGPMSVDDTLGVFLQIAAGVGAAHARDVIHRDLKPDNIKVLDDRRVKVLDFGLAMALEIESPPAKGDPPPARGPERDDAVTAFPFEILSAGSLSPSVTRTGAVLGTPGYMSPEQAFGDPVGKPADVWSFGCCMFEALTGESAFQGGTFHQLVHSILLGQPDWAKLDDVPAVVRDIVYDCLAKSPDERLHFATIVARLEAAGRELPSSRTRDAPPSPESLERRLFDMSRDILCVAGLDGFLKRVNPAFERALGWTSGELYSRPFIDFVHPDDREATLKEMEQLGQGISTFSFANRWECRDGTFRPLSWTAHLEPGTSLLYGVARIPAGGE